MVEMNDLQYSVDTYIVQHGYCNAKDNNKKDLVETGMKRYMIQKINELTTSISRSNLNELTLQELASILGELIPREEHEKTLSYLTHYVLGVAGFQQGCYITWSIQNNPAYISSPLIEDKEDGRWDKLITHKNTSYVETFALALEHFNKVMARKEKTNRQYLKTYQS